MNNKKIVRLTENQLQALIVESVKKILKEDEYTFMSDEDIAGQYNDMKVISLTLDRNTRTRGWNGSIEVEFPNADGEDFDNYIVDNFFVYDTGGKNIAFDHWYPNEQTNALKKIIRKEIRKKSRLR